MEQSRHSWARPAGLLGLIILLLGLGRWGIVNSMESRSVLALVAGSVLLALCLFAERRAILRSLRSFRTLIAFNVVLMTIAFVSILVLLNVFLHRPPRLIQKLVDPLAARANWSSSDFFIIQEPTRKLLDGLDRQINVYVFPYRIEEIEGVDVRTITAELLRVYSDMNPRIRVETLHALGETSRPRIEELNARFKSDSALRPVIVVEDPDTGRFHLVYQADLMRTAYESQRLHLKSFTGEAALSGAIRRVTEESKPLVVFLRGGRRERLVTDISPRGLSVLRARLENDGIETREMPYDAPGGFPPSAVICIAAPLRKLFSKEVEAIRGCLKGGGRVMVCLEPRGGSGRFAATSLEQVLRVYNIQVEDAYLYDEARGSMSDMLNPRAAKGYGRHSITDPVRDMSLRFVSVRGLGPLSEGGLGSCETSVLLRTGPEAARFDDLRDLPGSGRTGGGAAAPGAPYALAAHDTGNSARLVVIGDVDFASNHPEYGIEAVANYDFFRNAVFWLLDRDVDMGIAPRDTVTIRFMDEKAPKAALGWMFMSCFFVVVLGAAVWIVRSR